jgi:hypothetical protein
MDLPLLLLLMVARSLRPLLLLLEVTTVEHWQRLLSQRFHQNQQLFELPDKNPYPYPPSESDLRRLRPV